MRTLVMGDIHGAYNAMMQCFEKAGFDYEKDVLIQLGDIVDGNEYVYECVEELLKIKNLISLKGNHDDWFLDFIRIDLHPVSWNFGGKGTLTSYLKHAGKTGRFFASGNGFKTALNSDDIPQSHQTFFASQVPYYIDDKQRCFVHGGFDPELPFHSQQSETYYWNRGLWTDALLYRSKGLGLKFRTEFQEIYIGHTPTTRFDTNQPMNVFNIWNLDTGTGLNGRLTIMDIDTKEFWQSDQMGE